MTMYPVILTTLSCNHDIVITVTLSLQRYHVIKILLSYILPRHRFYVIMTTLTYYYDNEFILISHG
jgi:hypothetical protein